MKSMSLLFLPILALGCSSQAPAPKPVQSGGLAQAVREMGKLSPAERAQYLRKQSGAFSEMKVKEKSSP